jgi:hypothetical protein
MTDFVGKASKRMGRKKGQKSPFGSQEGVVESQQEWSLSLF